MAKLNEQQYAEDYGSQLAFLKSVPELYALFKQAIKGNWDPKKFQSKVQQTKWYKTNGETARQNAALAKADPATWNAKVNSTYAHIKDQAESLGATLSASQLKSLTNKYLNLGMNDSQLNDMLAGYIRFSHATGNAQSNINAMQQTAWRNGLRVSNASLQHWAQNIAKGGNSLDDFNDWAHKQAATLAPAYADQLKGGVDLYDVAQPYMQSMAQMLELNPADIDLFDPTIRQAMSARDPKGKPTSKSLWDFEQGLRNDKRWMSTKNAQDSFTSTAHSILSTFGLTN